MGLYMIWDVGASSDIFFIDCMFIVQIYKKKHVYWIENAHKY